MNSIFFLWLAENGSEFALVIGSVIAFVFIFRRYKIKHARKFSFLFVGVAVVFLILAAGNMSHLIELKVSDDTETELRIWLLICFAVLFPLSWLGTPKEFWGIAVGASLATAVACVMICICIALDMPEDLKSVEQPTVHFERFFSGMM